MLNIENYKEIVDSFHGTLLKTEGKYADIKPAEDKWALKEIIGHLVDSASNNHQRFVRLQKDDLLDFPAYDGEEWIKVQKYINMDWSILIELWYSYNRLLLNIIENVKETAYENVWVKGEDTIPLEQLIEDYYKHLKIHIEHFDNRLREVIEGKA